MPVSHVPFATGNYSGVVVVNWLVSAVLLGRVRSVSLLHLLAAVSGACVNGCRLSALLAGFHCRALVGDVAEAMLGAALRLPYILGLLALCVGEACARHLDIRSCSSGWIRKGVRLDRACNSLFEGCSASDEGPKRGRAFWGP